jgi:hypothetical protein
VSGLSHGSTAVEERSAFAHAMSELRLVAAEVEFILNNLCRRATHAADHDPYPTALRDRCATLATSLRAAHGQAHNTWRVMQRVEDHAMALKTLAPRNANAGSAAHRFAAETTHAATALSTAGTIVSGLSQDYYGGRAVLDAAILTHVVSMVRETTATLELTLHVVWRHANTAADNEGSPAPVRDRTRALADELAAATKGARRTTRVLRGLETQAADLKAAAQDLKRCPECGEPAVRATPTDLTPLQRAQGVRPGFAHRDRTQLCPVVGTDGYEPAQPVAATFTL